MDAMVAIPVGLGLLSIGSFITAIRHRTPTMEISPRGADIAGVVFGTAAAVTAVLVTDAPVRWGLVGLALILLVMVLLFVAAGPRAALERAKNPPPEPEPSTITIGAADIEVEHIHSMRMPPPLPSAPFAAPKVTPVEPTPQARESHEPVELAEIPRVDWPGIEHRTPRDVS